MDIDSLKEKFRVEIVGDCILILGDSKEVLKEIEGVHAVVTDPPYHLTSIVKRFGKEGSAPAKHGTDGAFARASKGFMGQTWDGGDIAFRPEFWEQVGNSMLPGAHILAFSGSRTYHRMAVGIEDAGFEIRDQIMWLYGCLTSDTECLTREGWKSYLEVTTSTDVMQWDHTSGKLSWAKPSKIHEYDFDGELINFKNRNTDQLLTPNHRVYAKVRRHSRHEKPSSYEVIEADVIHNRSSAWHVDLPLAGVLDDGEKVDPKYAYLMGWWLTDAWNHGDGKAIMFSQSKPATLEKLRKALEPFSPSEYTKKPRKCNHATEHTFYVTGDIAYKLKLDAPDRKLGWDVLGWNKEARAALFDGLMDGDGSRKEGQNVHVFWSKDQSRRDVFMALALSLGYRVYDCPSNYCVYVNMERDTTQLQHKHRANKVPYSGKVWCLTVPTGAFVVRRKGKAFITGNSGFPKSLDISKAIDKAAGAKREKVASGNPVKRMILGADQNATGSWIKDNGRVYQPGKELPSTDEAKHWDGWGTALKPSHEPVCMARKPLIGTNAENVLEHGTGGINIDGCRVPDDIGSLKEMPASFGPNKIYGKLDYNEGDLWSPSELGRWPANVIHDGSDEVLAGFPYTASGKPGKRRKAHTTGSMGTLGSLDRLETGYGDEGTAARFFYCAKASKKDRGEGNIHPTVKPLSLMRYLCRLITPPNGTILDPFMGSGSTGCAAIQEGFKFIGIEREEQYFEIALKRIKEAHNASPNCDADNVSNKPTGLSELF